VFGVLSDPESYEHWVVGSRSIDRHEPGWPAPGTRFEHTQGVRPVLIHDETESVASDPPHRLELIVKARPLLVARVIMRLEPEGEGTHVVMEEEPMSGIMAPLLRTPLGPPLIKMRNLESLRRLRKLAEVPA
jgi:uncharacterized protein YndB with AHSA1/START domain